MSITESVRIAVRALAANKLRAALTMLGIIIGVGAVIALLSIGHGAQAAIVRQIEGIGSNLIMIMPGSLDTGLSIGRSVSSDVLTVEDAEALARPSNCPDCLAVAPEFDRSAEIVHRSASAYTTVTGTTPEYAEIRNYQVEHGQFFSNQDVAAAARVVAIGASVAEDLFGPEEPVGRIVRINRVPFRVVAVFARRGLGGFGDSRDRIVAIPLSTAMHMFRRESAAGGRGDQVTLINVSARDADRIEPAINQITQVLRERHRIQYQEDDFSITSLKDIRDVMSSVTRVLTVFLAAIAAISLLVGGIGIMNIMLVSVVERTKEIGLRKAIGARRIDVLSQFLIEAVILSLAGGTVGILVGAGLSAVVDLTGVFAAQVSLRSVLLAAGFSAAVGLFFGIYPAQRAARLSPIEALRYE